MSLSVSIFFFLYFYIVDCRQRKIISLLCRDEFQSEF
jgi:hypothetical protein